MTWERGPASLCAAVPAQEAGLASSSWDINCSCDKLLLHLFRFSAEVFDVLEISHSAL